MIKIQTFYLKRNEDVHGISGEGIVGIGCIFPSGITMVEWLTFTSSLNQYKNLDHVREIHSHDGKTEIVLGDPPDEANITKVAVSKSASTSTTEDPKKKNKKAKSDTK